MKKALILFAIVSVVLAGCQMKSAGSSDAYGDSNATSNPPTSMSNADQTSLPKSGEQIAVIETNMGTIKIKFFANVAPETVKNFTELAKKGFYDGLIFHRVIPGFMIQGGDPEGTGLGGESYKGPNTTLKQEFNEMSHIRGAVSMARKGNDVNSASSQFFIVQNEDGAPFLDRQYTLFGQAYEGLDVVDKIAKVKRDREDRPLEPVVMKKVTIEVQP